MQNKKTLTSSRFERRTAEQWKDIIRRFEKGSQSIDVFCRQESIGKVTFNKWRNHYIKAGIKTESRKPADFIELMNSPPTLVDKKATGRNSQANWDIELDFGGGVICRLRRG